MTEMPMNVSKQSGFLVWLFQMIIVDGFASNLTQKNHISLIKKAMKYNETRRGLAFDYDYKDFEETSPDNYVDIAVTTQVTHNEVVDKDEPGQENVTAKISATAATIITSLSSVGFQDLVPITITTQKTTEIIITPVTEDPLVVEINKGKTKLGGYMSAGLVALLRSFLDLKTDHVRILMGALVRQIDSRHKTGQLKELGEYLTGFVMELSELLLIAEGDAVQTLAMYCAYSIENKDTALLPDSLAVLDIGNTLFLEPDTLPLIRVIRDIREYPKKKLSDDIAKDFLHLVLKKLNAVHNTSRGKLFLQGLEDIIKRKMAAPIRR